MDPAQQLTWGDDDVAAADHSARSAGGGLGRRRLGLWSVWGAVGLSPAAIILIILLILLLTGNLNL